ncbi:MaoC family dehydratase [Nocardioides sp. WS12]|uniref:MaoC family dehydratase n=1 Tax=Nocardioides sp. WS12 TaxID=2486272 RepID=UPI0015F9B9F4|nr:MaoC family dehydratase [Nocardioides sp. WS12]
MHIFTRTDELLESKETDLGASDWLLIEQTRIDSFAEATGDLQWIHTDPERARTGPFGTTIAHGYLTLSLIPVLVAQVYRVEGAKMIVNYGLDRVRFLSPVAVNSRLRARPFLANVDVTDTGAQVKLRTTIEIEGSEKPACISETISRIYF